VTLLASLRQRSGLTQDELARRAGTSRTRLSAYEHGHTDPGLETVARIAAAAGAELAILPAGTARVAAQIDAIRVAITVGDAPFALRLVAEIVAWVRDGRIDVSALDHEPGSVGDPRWDAMLGGIAEMLTRELGSTVPPWASAPGRFLDAPWFVTSMRSVRAFVFVETPASLAARGVFLSAASFRSV
jgi:transcriptional regulator with XRE-family HTH domain